MQIRRLTKVKAIDDDDIEFFQLVEFEINFFGTLEKFILDTKILKTGMQIVINGNGWIKDGFDITNL